MVLMTTQLKGAQSVPDCETPLTRMPAQKFGNSVECMDLFGKQTFAIFFGAANCNGSSWEEFTPCDGNRTRNCENPMGNLIGSKKLWESRDRESTSCFPNPSPRSPLLLLIHGHELAVSYHLQNRPILSWPIYLLKSSWCPCYFTFHTFSRIG